MHLPLNAGGPTYGHMMRNETGKPLIYNGKNWYCIGHNELICAPRSSRSRHTYTYL